MHETQSEVSTATVSGRLLVPFIGVSLELGVPIDLGLRQVGLSLTDLADPELRVSHAVANRLLWGAVSSSGERDLGLLAAERALPADLDVIEYVARAQPTVGQALESVMRYHALLHDGLRVRISREGALSVFSIDFGGLPIAEAAYEFALAVYLIATRRAIGLPSYAPSEVWFTHARPKSTARHQQIFRAPVRFGAEYNGLLFPHAHLAIPQVAADSGLAAVLDRYAGEVLAKLERTSDLSTRVRELVSHGLASGNFSAQGVAKRLGMSSRTLHRKLLETGTSYRSVVDEVRHAIALRYLQDPKLSIREVGYLLGFTTSPAFHRAFRRWTGMAPTSYRGEQDRKRA